MISAKQARALAQRAHAGVEDRHGLPYMNHVDEVADGVQEADKVAAYLHDTVEDTWVTLDYLRQQGVDPVDVAAVDLLTRDPAQGLTYMQYVQRVADAPGPAGARARRVKRRDLHVNRNRPKTPDMAGMKRRYDRAVALLEARMRELGEL